MGKFSNEYDIPEQGGAVESILERLGTTQKKIVMVVVFFALLFIGFYLNAIYILLSTGDATNLFSMSIPKIIMMGLTSFSGWIIIGVCLILVVILYFVVAAAGGNLERVVATDERGVSFTDKGTYGTAKWMTKEGAKECYEVVPIEEANGIILGQFIEKDDDKSGMSEKLQKLTKPLYNAAGKEQTPPARKGDGELVIALPGKRGANNNICVLGSPGTGKSFCFVRNAIYQAIKRGESVVVTDPKGELYESSTEILRHYGYKIKVFNLLNPTKSDAWDCASEIFSPVTGDVDETRVADFAEILMRNTTEGSMDEFWGPGEQNLLKAVIFYRAYIHEQSLISQYQTNANKKLFPNAALTPEDEAFVRSIIEHPTTTMAEREKAFRLLAQKVFGNSEQADEYVKATKANAEPCTIADIYYELIRNDLPAFERKFAQIPVSHPASIAWGIFKNSSPNTQPGFVTGLAQKLQLFQMRDVRRITSNKDINLADISAEKTAVFVIISDKSTAMRPISSLFFNFLFKDVSDAADTYGSDKRLPVNVICDEFANLGRMPQFEVVISTVRSRLINISIILQSVTQLNKVYSEEDANTIIACCDTILFIGCNDTETADFISDLSGIATIQALSYKDSRSSLGYRNSVMAGYSESDGDGKRNLMNSDEVRRLPADEVLIYHRGHDMLKANRCGYIAHPYFKKHYAAGATEPLPTTRLVDYPLASVKYAITENIDAFLAGDAINANVNLDNSGVMTVATSAPQPTAPKKPNDLASLMANRFGGTSASFSDAKPEPQANFNPAPEKEENNRSKEGDKTNRGDSGSKVKNKLPNGKQSSNNAQNTPQKRKNIFDD